jgi:hypothetical protein
VSEEYFAHIFGVEEKAKKKKNKHRGEGNKQSEVIFSFDTPADFHRTARRYIPEDRTRQEN